MTLERGADPSDPLINASSDGSFKRQVSKFRNVIDPSGPFPPEKDRYALYAFEGCPWAHRALIMVAVKGLSSIIQVIKASSALPTNVWLFNEEYPDPLYGSTGTRDIYLKSDPSYANRYTVPILWDKKTEK